MRKLTHFAGARPLLIAAAFCAAVPGARATPITYSITIDLSSFHPGSSYSGSVTVPDVLLTGESAPITLFASPAAQYSPSSILNTVSIGTGPFGFNSVFINPLVFTDTSTSLTYDFIVNGAAHCDVETNPNGVPCQTSGQLIGNNPNGGGVLSYMVSIAPAAVPEPAMGLPLLMLGAAGIFFRRRSQKKTFCNASGGPLEHAPHP
jgi:hypothetical protein